MKFDSEDFKDKVCRFIDSSKPGSKVNTDASRFIKFWKNKINLENGGSCLLDQKQIENTSKELLEMAKKWRLYRPEKTDEINRRLCITLPKIRAEYEKIRKFNVLDIETEDFQIDTLKVVWTKLALIKDGNEEKKSRGEYLIMPPTKFLMFLWGQTPAFDEFLRGKDNRQKAENFKIHIYSNNYWSFDNWFDTLKLISKALNGNDIFRKTIENLNEKYFNGVLGSSYVPYGFFIDAYFWQSVKEKKAKQSVMV